MIVFADRTNATDALYDRLAPMFVTAVHRNDALAAPTQPLMRWEAPVRVVIAGRNNSFWRPRVEGWLAELSRVSGHDIALASAAPFNVVLLFADGFAADSERIPVYREILQHAVKNPDFVALMGEADRKEEACFGMSFRPDNVVLGSSIVMISERASGALQNFCVYWWLLGITGVSFWNVTVSAPQLVTISPEGHPSLTETGGQILRVVYDRRLRHGMTVDETLPLLPAIVEGLR